MERRFHSENPDKLNLISYKNTNKKEIKNYEKITYEPSAFR